LDGNVKFVSPVDRVPVERCYAGRQGDRSVRSM